MISSSSCHSESAAGGNLNLPVTRLEVTSQSHAASPRRRLLARLAPVAMQRENGHYYIESSFALFWNPPGIYPRQHRAAAQRARGDIQAVTVTSHAGSLTGRGPGPSAARRRSPYQPVARRGPAGSRSHQKGQWRPQLPGQWPGAGLDDGWPEPCRAAAADLGACRTVLCS